MSTNKQPDSISFVPINRKFFDHPFWKEERTYSKAEAWLYLIQAARFEDSKATELIGGQMVSWTRGQLPASLRFLAGKWKWDKNKVDRFLQLLESEQMITRHQVNGQTIIELTNFEKYRQTGQGKGQPNQPQDSIPPDEPDTKRDSDQDTGGTGAGQARDNTNKDNKVNTGNTGKEEESGAVAPAPKKSFKLLTDQEFVEELRAFKDVYPYEILNGFYKYWKEKNSKGKMRFQLEKTWELDLRLEKWSDNQEKFNAKKIVNGSHKQTPTGAKAGRSDINEQARATY
jgi:hypothetical protein